MLKQSLALGALAVSLISCPAQATNHQPSSIHTREVDLGDLPPIDLVSAANVAVVTADDLPSPSASAGLHHLRCLQRHDQRDCDLHQHQDAPAITEAASFTHEAVHLAQDCKAWHLQQDPWLLAMQMTYTGLGPRGTT